LRDAAELGGHPGSDDCSMAAAIRDERARVSHVLSVAKRQPHVVEVGGRLLNGR
jgi:hypothetical protein